MHLDTPPPRASDVVAVSPAVDAVIHRCMEKRPEARFQTVDELMVALHCAAEDPQRRERVVTAVALHVDVASPEALGEPSAFSADCDRVLAETRQLFVSAKFTTVVASSNWVLGIKPAANEEDVATLTEAAQDLSRRLQSRPDPIGRIRVALRRAPVTLRADHQFEGDLLFAHDWAEQHRID